MIDETFGERVMLSSEQKIDLFKRSFLNLHCTDDFLDPIDTIRLHLRGDLDSTFRGYAFESIESIDSFVDNIDWIGLDMRCTESNPVITYVNFTMKRIDVRMAAVRLNRTILSNHLEESQSIRWNYDSIYYCDEGSIDVPDNLTHIKDLFLDKEEEGWYDFLHWYRNQLLIRSL